MQRIAARYTAASLLFAAFLIGCGGGDGSPTAPSGGGNPPGTPNPPSQPGPPARAVVQAGNGQRGDPGSVLPVSPSVLVTDSAGKPVPGVSVSFRVDSGGGSVTSPSASTGANGTASAGSWQLGPSEGQNVLTATVGSLAPVRFTATAEVSVSTVAQQSIAAGGGTVSVTQGVLSGAKVVIPPSALPAASWTLQQKPVSSWPSREYVTPLGAVLHIMSSASGVASSPLSITLPLPSPASGSKPFVIMRNASGSGMQVLQTVSTEGGMITAVTSNLDAGMLSTVASDRFGSLFDAQSGSGYDVDVVVATIPVSRLDGDVDTGFRPGTDDWDFRMLPTSYGNVSLKPGAPTEVGAAISQMVYYASLKGSRGALNGRYREIKSIGESNRVGYHSAAYTAHADALGNLIASVRTIRTSMRATMVDQVFYDVLKANMIVTGLPQLMVAAYGESQWVPLTAYRVVSGRVDVANPFKPGEGAAVQFASGAFERPSLVRGVSGNSGVPDWIGATAIGQWINTSKLAGNLNTIIDGSEPGGASTWPEATLNVRGGIADDTSMIIVDDTARFWFTCRDCKTSTASTLSQDGIEPFVGVLVDGSGNPASQFDGQGNSGALATQREPVESRIGFVNFESPSVGDVSWLDFRWYKVYKWALDWAEDDISADVGAEVTLSVTVDGPTAPPHTFRWTIGSGEDQEVLTSEGPTVEVVFRKEGEIPVVAEMVRKSDGRAIARKADTVKAIAKPWAAWRITHFSLIESTDGLRFTQIPDGGGRSYWEVFLTGNWWGQNMTQNMVNQIRWDSLAVAPIVAGTVPAAIIFLSRDASGQDGEPTAWKFGEVHGVYVVTSSFVPKANATWPPGLAVLGAEAGLARGFSVAVADRGLYLDNPNQRPSCSPLFSYDYTETGDLMNGTAGSVKGSYWTWKRNLGFDLEPVAARSVDMWLEDSETLVGNIKFTYRLSIACTGETAHRQVPWTLKYGFQAKRIR